ncbi:phenylalanyl-tRNA synthetase subunit beta [Spiroplasma chinense]|uniref:Phenylalanine--tRNA ligase beta subunit n=1 Tax=Spiroplasma chinense TaxID=216932 RepID=A0A5B9Y575_9MOLU|nr:phenylalanine--tRNA ligase subunit beta [Spiroplasma chinense]QEH62110.1 phenylalanyl-tRNA synthetase subunit beta [Spiroplasma chinense]
MIITRKWLENFIDLTGIKDEKITEAFNSLGFEVDAYKTYKGLNDKLKLAHVGNVAPMEGTHLNFCFVDLGEDLVTPIVCGANNVKEGQYVIVAEPGKTIANGLTLDKREIKGKMSEGMICALTEIGLSESALSDSEKDGIYSIHLKDEEYSHIGQTDVLDLIGFNDSTWEVDLTINRSDALGAMQLLKEVANYFEKEINDISKQLEPKKSSNNVPVSFKNSAEIDKKINSIAMQMFDIKEIHSIDEWDLNIFANQDIWLKFNDVKTTDNFWLDLANIIALETGQPVIFLDPSKLKSQLEIKNNSNDKFETNLQIMCENEVISTLGVDYNHEFLPTKDSKNVLAIYLSLDPILMRKQQKAHNTSGVFLQRWMKPISDKLYNLASQRTIYWFDQYSLYGASSELEIQKESSAKENKVIVSLERINEIIGINLTVKDITSLFRTLDFVVEEKDGQFTFTIDQNRTDISHEAHIVEEIARLYGYDNIKSQPVVLTANAKEKQLNNKIKGQVENYLIGQGFNNIKTYSLQNGENVEKWNLFDIKEPIKLMSPLSKLREVYRLSTVLSAIEIAGFNYSKGNKNVKLYEFADVYNAKNLRENHLSVVISGEMLQDKAFDVNVKASYEYVKGILDSILGHYQLDFDELKFEQMQNTIDEIHPHINAKILYKGELLGFIFKLNPRFEQSNKLDSTFAFELNITKINEVFNHSVAVKELSKYQKTSRDVTILLGEEKQYNEVLKQIKEGINYIVDIKLVDIYQDKALQSKNLKAVSIGFEFNSAEKQLKDEDVSKEWDALLGNIKKLNIEIK